MNSPRVCLKRQGVWGFIADLLMMPIMYLIQGTLCEKPQRTHKWNNAEFVPVTPLEKKQMVKVARDRTASKRWWLGFIPVFHIPILGGWREYVVLELMDDSIRYHVGFKFKEGGAEYCKYSLIPVRGRVRMLRGDGDVCFFAVSRTGRQLPLKIVGYGRIGVKGPYSRDTFL